MLVWVNLFWFTNTLSSIVIMEDSNWRESMKIFFSYEIGDLEGWNWLITSSGIIYCTNSHGTSPTIKLSAWITSRNSFSTLPLPQLYMCRVMWSLYLPHKGRESYWSLGYTKALEYTLLLALGHSQGGKFWKWSTRKSLILNWGWAFSSPEKERDFSHTEGLW